MTNLPFALKSPAVLRTISWKTLLACIAGVLLACTIAHAELPVAVPETTAAELARIREGNISWVASRVLELAIPLFLFTGLGTWRTKAKLTSTLCRPLSRKCPNRCGGIVLFGLIMLALGCLRASAQAPQANAPLELKRGQVTIFRDRWGMAHLYAAREEDGFFGLGYATAEDRLEQVLLLYLGVKGELAPTRWDRCSAGRYLTRSPPTFG
jgi:hypothetical protein